MKIIRQHVQGRLLKANGRTANGRAALLLFNPEPEEVTAESLYLCFALLVRGPEDHILPAVLKDDWGNERRGLDMYAWLADEGDQFPRSEIFGFNVDGSETQCFLRALELHLKYPCYVYQSKNAVVAEGVLLKAILLPDQNVVVPQKIKRPSHLAGPLANGAVSWWQVPPDVTSFDFS